MAKAFALWQRLQLSHRGLYSFERMQALEEYTRKTSMTRVVLVCFLTPVPTLLIVLTSECIPLQDPTLGWARNPSSWVRAFIACFCVAIGALLQVRSMIPDLPITIGKGLSISFLTSSCCTISTMMVSRATVYPIPFSMLLAIVPFMIIFVALFAIVVGKQAFVKIPKLALQLRMQMQILLAEASLVLIYPAFSSVFMTLSGINQTIALLTLPVVKIAMRNIVARAASGLEDFIPEIVVFSVDLFNSLYLASCLQTTRTLVTTSLILAFDMLMTTQAIRTVYLNTQGLRQLARSSLSQGDTPKKQHAQHHIIPIIVRMTKKPGALARGMTKVRLRSPIMFNLSVRSRGILDRLVSHRERVLTHVRRRTTVFWRRRSAFGPVSMAPSDTTEMGAAVTPVLNTPQSREPMELLVECLKMLFHSEVLVLVAYVKCVTPLIYGIYLVTIFHLPNAAFYPQTRFLTDAQLRETIFNLFLYVSLEVAAFTSLHVILSKKMHFSPIYMLAFVLDKQILHVQSRLLIWVVFLLPLRLMHYGACLCFCFHQLRAQSKSLL